MKIKGGNVYLKGEIEVPGDKSISHRAIMIGALSDGRTEVHNFLLGKDCLSTVECFRNMGVNIDIKKNKVFIEGPGLKGLKEPKKTLNVGNSGTTIRLLSGILAGQNFTSYITGDKSIQRRPMDRIITPLRKMGANIKGKDDKFAPLEIRPSNRLKGITYKQPVASAQVKSCLLFAGLYSEGITKVIQPKISRDHTERMLKYFGADIKVTGNEVYIKSGNKLKGKKVIVPGDISSAAFFMVAALILKGSKLTLKNVGLNETRTGIIDVLKAMGGNIKISNLKTVNNEPIGDIHVKHSKLKGVTIEGDLIPRLIDEIPIIAVAASVAEGTTIIKDASELKVKESNRIKAMVDELTKMGVDIEEREDGMIIKGNKKLNSAFLKTYADHRIAMSLSIASLYADGESELEETDSIAVSFPNFFNLVDKVKS
ncbi:3-phosphoshikimate 1-carboxyvinyltransferase [Thermohalobacter berrensis]|uniref:3-phosphoshikimate 1-carboxyvinyltransferase n=1 Tax=Thermohalobacter berrensis TaxID=99594 RepID=A0A419T9Y1_9FIRM|nr:3-phosphoshikimate 1-carboxyvinyltransferase [Thermohalobacter berrensis]RKD34276.1 3-phosphoshikimate 1-carboxyvinyltransferase [Thermohalobacter berrensis]